MNEAGAACWALPRGPSPAEPSKTPARHGTSFPLSPGPHHTHRPLEQPSSQSLALISCLAGQHRLWPQADIKPNPGTSTSQRGDLSLWLPLSEPGFLSYKTGVIRGPIS